MNILNVKKIIKKENRIEVEYEINGEWSKYFNLKENFFIEYDRNIEIVPDSICIIPFLANVLPISWVNDATISLNELDKTFYSCLEEVKIGYVNMFPKIKFAGELKVNNLLDNSYDESNNVALFFSGGLDSFSTLIGHIEEKPQILTIWGSDIKLDDIEGWKNVENHVKQVSKEFKVQTNFIKTNFRTFIDEAALSNLVFSKVNDGWWHGFQHGIAIISQGAPIAYLDKLSKIYIASSYSEHNKAITCASDPTIDNFVKFANCNVLHDQYELSRMEKAKKVIRYAQKTGIYSQLRVCWISSGGKNCCKCEKCYRTIYELVACGADPNEYGLNINDDINKSAKNYFLYKRFIDTPAIPLWKEIKEEFIKKKDIFGTSQYKWVYKLEPESGNNNTLKKLVILAKKIKRKIMNR